MTRHYYARESRPIQHGKSLDVRVTVGEHNSYKHICSYLESGWQSPVRPSGANFATVDPSPA